MKSLKTRHQTFATDLNELDRVLSLYDQIKDPIIPTKVWLEGQLALAEGFTNAVRHAHRDMSTDVPIEVEVRLFLGRFEIRIWDRGLCFDLKSAIKEYGQVRDRLTPGKRGLLILDKIADELSYTRLDNERNCLLIVKYF